MAGASTIPDWPQDASRCGVFHDARTRPRAWTRPNPRRDAIFKQKSNGRCSTSPAPAAQRPSKHKSNDLGVTHAKSVRLAQHRIGDPTVLIAVRNDRSRRCRRVVDTLPLQEVTS
jgi:hypothetical protein